MLDRQGRLLVTWNAGEGFFSPGAWLDADRLLGNVQVPETWLPTAVPGFFAGQLPAVMDVVRGEVAPIIDPFLKPPLLNGRNHVEAVARGLLLRVSAVGDCLHVRETPDAGAISLACVADRVLLRDLQEARETAGITWRRVRLSDGRAGWASAAYLER